MTLNRFIVPPDSCPSDAMFVGSVIAWITVPVESRVLNVPPYANWNSLWATDIDVMLGKSSVKPNVLKF